METLAGQETTTPPPSFRVFFIPFFATGHIIPMVDLARQFAARGVDSTVVLTPANAALAHRTVDRAARAGHHIRILTYPFPAAEAGLPEGQENLATVPSSESGKIERAPDLVRGSHHQILREHRPDAVVVDVPMSDVTTDLDIPRLTFHVIGAFSQCVMSSLYKSRAHERLAGHEDWPFVVPDLPDCVEMVRSELPEFLQRRDHLAEKFERLRKARLEGYGAVVNSFYELEPAYADLYRRVDGLRTWFVGPLALCDDDDDEAAVKVERGADDSSVAEAEGCVAWLGTQSPVSVVFVCFGSWSHFSRKQLREMALGLESSGCPFLWVLREEDFAGGADVEWLPAGFEDRVSGRGFVARGWAPQVVILNHPAVGAFVTHCGWNSLTEGLSAGVPMITWPLAFDHFICERLVVQLLRVGVKMYDGFRSTLPEEAARVVVSREIIARVVGRFVPGVDEEVEGMRSRVRKYAAAARAAMKEGGSSFRDLDRMVEDLKSHCKKKEPTSSP